MLQNETAPLVACIMGDIFRVAIVEEQISHQSYPLQNHIKMQYSIFTVNRYGAPFYQILFYVVYTVSFSPSK